MTLTIQTERLTLRPCQLSNAAELRVLAGSFAVARMLSRMSHPYPEGEAERWIGTHEDQRAKGAGYPFAITLDGKLRGTVAVRCGDCCGFELGYWLMESAWGQDFATEAVRGVLSFAFDELGLAFVRAQHIADNRASARVLTKMGFLGTGRASTFHSVRQTEVEMTHLIVLRDAFVRSPSVCERQAA